MINFDSSVCISIQMWFDPDLSPTRVETTNQSIISFWPHKSTSGTMSRNSHKHSSKPHGKPSQKSWADIVKPYGLRTGRPSSLYVCEDGWGNTSGNIVHDRINAITLLCDCGQKQTWYIYSTGKSTKQSNFYSSNNFNQKWVDATVAA